MHIEPQRDRREEVLCKQVTKFLAEKDGQAVAYPVTFPCLRVVVKGDGDGEDQSYVVTWSNYHEHEGESPGKFILKRVENRPVLFYETDSQTGRKILHKGRPVLDYVSMAKWGTHWSPQGPVFGENHRRKEIVVWKTEAESLVSAQRMLAEQFGEQLAKRVIVLFLEHELFQQYELAAAA